VLELIHKKGILMEDKARPHIATEKSFSNFLVIKTYLPMKMMMGYQKFEHNVLHFMWKKH
jgi:hypothetical protein